MVFRQLLGLRCHLEGAKCSELLLPQVCNQKLIHGCSTRLQLLHASLVALSPEPFTDFNLATLRLHGMSWGVKTTCFKAPGVSLGGSGVSIGRVRILSVSWIPLDWKPSRYKQDVDRHKDLWEGMAPSLPLSAMRLGSGFVGISVLGAPPRGTALVSAATMYKEQQATASLEEFDWNVP